MTAASSGEVLLSVRGLRTSFRMGHGGEVTAVDGVSFDVRRGEVYAIVGESGSGKSVTAMSIMGLLPDSARVEGEGVLWKGENLLAADDGRMRRLRGKEIAMIFQDPLTALNPVHTVGRQIGEMLRIHENANRRSARARAIELLDLVGIPNASERANMHPHEFSGGMRQRAMIAMAIACGPDLLIADEPTTALDVTVQAQVFEVLMRIKKEIDSAMILITHDLGVVAGIADRVMVMYGGREVEVGMTDDIYYRSRHPYTLGLLASLPRLDDVGTEHLRPIPGSPPSLVNRPPGCAFHPRCAFVDLQGPCVETRTELVSVGLGHWSACHRREDLEGVTVATVRAGDGNG